MVGYELILPINSGWFHWEWGKCNTMSVEQHLRLYLKLKTLQWRLNERDGASSHRSLDYLLEPLVRSKKTWMLRVTGICEGNSPVTSEFPTQNANNAENASIWLRHHESAGNNSLSEINKAQQNRVHFRGTNCCLTFQRIILDGKINGMSYNHVGMSLNRINTGCAIDLLTFWPPVWSAK